MSVEIFTKKQFEDALPKHKTSGQALWTEKGLDKGEYTYGMKIKDGVHISIRSSVKVHGTSAETGKDSIRAHLCDVEGKPLGSKVNAYTTRVKGWEERLTGILRELWGRGMNDKLKPCPSCGKMKGVFQVKKDGKNKGRLFVACPGDHFKDTFRFL